MADSSKLNEDQLAAVSAGAYTGATTTYVVVKGDTLESIAQRFNTDVRTIKRLNGIIFNKWLRAGEILTVPNLSGQVLTVGKL